jgi:SH3 domain protein
MAMASLGKSPAASLSTPEALVNRFACVCVALLLGLCAQPAVAEQRYISDDLRVSVRAGAGDGYRIIAVLPSGSQVETLETGGDWTRVRTAEGDTGWMRSQYLQAEPIAAQRLSKVQAELERARTRIEELEKASREARQAADSARERIAELESRNETLRGRLSKAERGLELAETNEELNAQVQQLQDEVATLRTRNDELTGHARQRWFAIGAGVLLGGILIGIIVTRIPWRSRRSRLFE